MEFKGLGFGGRKTRLLMQGIYISLAIGIAVHDDVLREAGGSWSRAWRQV